MDRLAQLDALTAARREAKPKRREPKDKPERVEVKQKRAEWGKRALAAIEAVAARGKSFTVEDVEDYLGNDLPRHKNAWGAIFKAAGAHGLVQDGTKQSEKPAARGRRIQVWRRA